MTSQLDLDAGGTFRQTQRVFMGPSIGWVNAPITSILPVTAAGTTVIQLGNTLITVNVNGAVTLQLPKFKGNQAGAGGLPSNYGAFTLQPDVINGGATLIQ